jgi:hypothetical protein
MGELVVLAEALRYSSPILTRLTGSYVFGEAREPVIGVYRQNGGYKWVFEAGRKDRSGHNVIVMWDNNVRMTLGGLGSKRFDQ